MKLRYKVSPGEDVSHAIGGMVKMADAEKCVVRCAFNDTEIVVRPGDALRDILTRWTDERNAKYAAWLKSPEGIESERRSAEFRRQAEAAEAEGILPFEISDKDGWSKTIENNQSGW